MKKFFLTNLILSFVLTYSFAQTNEQAYQENRLKELNEKSILQSFFGFHGFTLDMRIKHSLAIQKYIPVKYEDKLKEFYASYERMGAYTPKHEDIYRYTISITNLGERETFVNFSNARFNSSPAILINKNFQFNVPGRSIYIITYLAADKPSVQKGSVAAMLSNFQGIEAIEKRVHTANFELFLPIKNYFPYYMVKREIKKIPN